MSNYRYSYYYITHITILIKIKQKPKICTIRYNPNITITNLWLKKTKQLIKNAGKIIYLKQK